MLIEDNSCIEKGVLLGSGAFASVYECRFKEVNIKFAYKELRATDTKRSKNNMSKELELEERFMKEIELLSNLSHPYIIGFLGWTKNPLDEHQRSLRSY